MEDTGSTLMPGQKLGPYEVLGHLGSGGMGEVYRARDPRLGREVAIKVLPERCAGDADALGRFEREARAVAALSHPNITPLYDFGKEGKHTYAVMELLEGCTLRDALAEGPLPTPRALDYAVQTARGLAAAHEGGVVHRDLKPENLFITHSGLLKILDFGLARVTDPEGPGRAVGETRTLTVKTQTGTLLGTVGYMSPEQVRGQLADARSDIFSFGAILYEMLSGRRAFQGESAVESLNAVLKEEPPALPEVAQGLPSALDRVVRRCLEKRPENRFQSARDLAFHLECVAEPSGVRQTEPAMGPRPGSPRRWRLAAAVAGALLALGAMLAIGYRLGGGSGRSGAPSFDRLTFRRGVVSSARFAKDGQTVVYSAAWEGEAARIYLKRPESPDALALDLPPAEILSVSASGEMAVLLGPRPVHVGTRTGTLARVSLTGGAPREVAEGVAEADWEPSGSGMAVVRVTGQTTRLEYPMGKALTGGETRVSHARFSPDGKRLALFEHPLPVDDRGSVAVVDLKGRKKILSAGWQSVLGLAWSPTGREVWFTAATEGLPRALYGVTLGGRVRLITRIPGQLEILDATPDGRVLLRRDDFRVGIICQPPGEAKERDLTWLNWSIARHLSPDGRLLLFEEEDTGPNYSVCVRGTDGSPVVQLGDGIAFDLSGDGRWVLSRVPSPAEPLMVVPRGAGEPKKLRIEGLTPLQARWFPDGRRALVAGNGPDQKARLLVLDTETGASREVPTGTSPPTSVMDLCLSPDGGMVATTGPGKRIWLYPLGGGVPAPAPGAEDGEKALRWTEDGKWLFVARLNPLPTRIIRLDPATGRREPWKEFTPQDPAGFLGIFNFFLTPDGSSYAYTYTRSLTELYLVRGLK